MKVKMSFLILALVLFYLAPAFGQETQEKLFQEEAVDAGQAPIEEAPTEDILGQAQEEPSLTEPEPARSGLVSFSGTNIQTPPSVQGKISLDIKGMDIIDVLKMLSTRTGMNIVVGKGVTGRVTLFLKNVDPWDAFEIILLSNDLAYESRGDIFNVMTQRDYELRNGERFQDKKQAKAVQLKYAKAVDLARALSQIKTKIGKVIADEASNMLVLIDIPEKMQEMLKFVKDADSPVKTQVFSLNYATADKLSAKIQETITKGVGAIKIDERTNKIAITDYPEKLDGIAKIISAFDEKTPQVLIDAQIIEVKPTDKYEMGIDWDYWIRKHFRITASLPIGTTNRLLLGTTTTAPAGSGDYKAVLDLLRTIGETKILSSPRIMALNNQEAKILVGTKDAYITSSTSQAGDSAVTSQTVNFVDVGIKLFVTPTINADGFVTMKIKPEISSATRTDITSEGKVTQIPIVTTSEVETSVMIKDGLTIVIGGLQKDEKTKIVKHVPVFGDIPLLGMLFRNRSEEIKKTELVILLTPHIVSGNSSYTEFSSLQPKEGAVFKMEDGEIVSQKVVSDSMSITPKDKAEIMNQYKQLVWTKIQKIVSTYTDKAEVYKGQARVVFVVNREGALKGQPIATFSDNEMLSAIAVQSIKEASPFPAFPESSDDGELQFNIEFSSG